VHHHTTTWSVSSLSHQDPSGKTAYDRRVPVLQCRCGKLTWWWPWFASVWLLQKRGFGNPHRFYSEDKQYSIIAGSIRPDTQTANAGNFYDRKGLPPPPALTLQVLVVGVVPTLQKVLLHQLHGMGKNFHTSWGHSRQAKELWTIHKQGKTSEATS